MTSLRVRWAWTFLDVPWPNAAPALAWWAERSGTAPGPVRGDDDEFATLHPTTGPAWLKFQAVQRPAGPATHHLDLDVDDPATAAELAVGLGARQVREDDGYVVMVSPGGFTFCLTTWDGVARGSIRDHAGASLADQLCLDVPPAVFDRELEFWSTLGDWDIRSSATHAEFHWATPDLPMRLLFQRLDDAPTGATVTGHIDLACADRMQEVGRHVEAGATIVHQRPERPAWTVLSDPWGTVYCCTDRLPSTGTPPTTLEG